VASLGGNIGRTIRTRQKGDAPLYRPEPGATSCGYDDENRIIWQGWGDDGPIRKGTDYILVDEDSGREETRNRPLLRRAQQFVFDSRHFARPYLERDRYRLAQKALDESPLALETKTQIYSYLDTPVAHPYLSYLNLCDVYRPFPETGKKCSECQGKKARVGQRSFKQTCPFDSLTVWNLGLRAFHTFHRTSRKEPWLVCRHEECAGHHSQASWSVTDETDWASLLKGIVRNRCGADKTLNSVGLGPFEHVTLSNCEADDQRKERLFCSKPPHDDADKELKMIGGIGGLWRAMVDGQTLLGSWSGEEGGGRTSCDPEWALGRSRADEQHSQTAFASLHRSGLY